MNQRGYIGLVLLLLGTAFALYLFTMHPPLGYGASDQGVMNALEIKARAEAVKGNAEHMNGEYEAMMGE